MKESKFTGGLLGLVGISILQWFLIVFTLGLGAPWAICMRERWVAKHTIVDGKAMSFDGTGLQLFGTYIKWWLLCFVTFGIYGLWLGIKMKQWVVKHTHFAE